MHDFRRFYERASSRSRKQFVSTLLLQGLSYKKMSKIVGVDEAVVRNDFDSAVEEIRQELESLPEGPMLMAQVAIEGYSRFVALILNLVHERLEADPTDTNTIQSMARLGLDAMDRKLNHMEKWGLLPVPGKIVGHGGIRPTDGPRPDPMDWLKRYAEDNGVDLNAMQKQITEEAVQ